MSRGLGVDPSWRANWNRGDAEVAEDTQSISSLIGSRFSGRVIEDTEFGPHRAVTPEVAGRALITGRHDFVIDPADALRHGFILRLHRADLRQIGLAVQDMA